MILDAPTWAINLAGWVVIGHIAYEILYALVKVGAPGAIRSIDWVTP